MKPNNKTWFRGLKDAENLMQSGRINEMLTTAKTEFGEYGKGFRDYVEHFKNRIKARSK